MTALRHIHVWPWPAMITRLQIMQMADDLPGCCSWNCVQSFHNYYLAGCKAAIALSGICANWQGRMRMQRQSKPVWQACIMMPPAKRELQSWCLKCTSAPWELAPQDNVPISFQLNQACAVLVILLCISKVSLCTQKGVGKFIHASAKSAHIYISSLPCQRL